MDNDKIREIRERCDEIEAAAWGNTDGSDPDMTNAGMSVRQVRELIGMVEAARFINSDTAKDALTKAQGDRIGKLEEALKLADEDKAAISKLYLDAHNERVKAIEQLAESKRREQAAVRDLKKPMMASKHACIVCADGNCENASNCDPEWRGLLEAVAGEVITPEIKAKVAELFVRSDELFEEQATFIEELQRRLGIAERVCYAARMYIKHINSPLCMGWDLLLEALQKQSEEKQIQAAPEQEEE